MPDELRATALVLRAVDYGESDRIVTFFTREQGKVTAFARSARKSRRRFGGSLELFHRLDIRYRDRRGDLLSLAAAEIQRARPSLLLEYDLITRASYLVELVTEVTRDREAHADLFDLLDGGLEALAAPSFASAPAPKRDGWLAAFELKLLSLAGYRPVLEACVECGDAGATRYRFLPERGAILCVPCAPPQGGIPVSAGTLAILDASLQADLVHPSPYPLPEGGGNSEVVLGLTFSAEQVAEARRLLGAFLRWQLGKELKSAKFLVP